MTNNTLSILDQMYSKDRAIITAQLTLANGHFLQPTGFPDIGSCIYTDADGNKRCLVESEQSMANRLEAVCMKSPGYWVDDLAGLPVIEVRDAKGSLLATNLTEPHRLASSYVLEGSSNGKDIKAKLAEKLGLGDGGASWPLDKRDVLEKLVFALDPAALLHGFQFVQWKFVGLRQTRLLSARVDCLLAEEPEVHYGMVKFDLIEPGAQGEGTNKGQSIAAKSRVVAAKDGIKATFDIDLLGLKSLAIEKDQQKFLLALALWKIGAFLLNKAAFDARSRQTGPSLRLRADCYLSCGEGRVTWSETVTDSKPKAIDPKELINAMPMERPDFKELAGDQFKFVREQGDEKRLAMQVTYKKKSASTTAPTATPASETSQAGEADVPEG